jgi:hypothetical protein
MEDSTNDVSITCVRYLRGEINQTQMNYLLSIEGYNEDDIERLVQSHYDAMILVKKASFVLSFCIVSALFLLTGLVVYLIFN